MARRKRIRVLTNCVANRYASDPGERIVEFMGSKLGGLIAFTEMDDGALRVEVYRCDPGVIVRVGDTAIPTEASEWRFDHRRLQLEK